MPELMSGQRFLLDLPDQLAHASERVVLGTMFCAPGQKLDNIRNALTNVDPRVGKFVGTDIGGHDNVVSEPGMAERLDEWKDWCEQNGVDFATLGSSYWRKILPSTGRLGLIGANHSRVTVVDETFATGDSSFMDDANDYNLMVRVQSRMAADWADKRYRYRPNLPHPESIVLVDDDTTIIADNNQFGSGSLILDTALHLVDTAQESVITTSQFAPNGKMLKSLIRSHAAGLDTSAYFGNFDEPRMEGFATYYRSKLRRAKPKFPVAAIAFTSMSVDGKVTRQPLHCKSLGIDIPKPNEEIPDTARVLVGSHEFTSLGGYMGVEECAVVTKDPQTIRNYSYLVQRLHTLGSGGKT